MRGNGNGRRRLPGIGGRIWKTGIAVALSLGICRALKIPEPVFAGVAAVIVMQPTVLKTFRKGLERLQATVVGAAVALGMLALVTQYPLPYVKSAAAGAAVIIVLWLCLALKWFDAMVLAAATVVVVMIHSEEGPSIYIYAAERTLVTAIGIVVASVVNAFVFWPRVEDRFPRRLPGIAKRAFEEFEAAVRAFCRRNIEEARELYERWKESATDFEMAASELSWLQDSVAVRQALSRQQEEQAEALAGIYSVVESSHQAAGRLLEDTISILEERPEYLHHDAEVYSIIETALEPASALSSAIVSCLESGDYSGLSDADHAWTDQLHAQFVRAMRSAHRSPRDLFPLFEAAKVGIELRNYTRQLAELRDLILRHRESLSLLRRQ